MNKRTIWKKPATWTWAFLLSVSLLVLMTACIRQTSTSEDTAIQFYKAVWVDGDIQHARSFVSPSVKGRELTWRIEETRRNRPVNSPILIVESPLHASMNPARKIYLIRRPRDRRDFQVELARQDGHWIVTGFKQNYHSLRGGYNSDETFERLQYEHPGLKWRHIDQP
ncbi:hypothetical protein [Polycladomyces subterraneus]|uniref:Lipoprotein n=1 Tax=Polycladomyces subterraneus TaxID=1016997 RepID=A0ABT8IJ67_9BACL|nr:hypothetical protein [Polycladomyces subterraneus]MDN4592827.1 hypothetical protein [Polycladomyces subterraneus]